MKKFISIINIILILLLPTIILVNSSSNAVNYNYKSNARTQTKMIKTTVLLDRSNKKQEEEEKEQQRQEELKKLEEIEKEKQKEAAKEVEAVTETRVVGSLESGGNNTTNKTVKVVTNSDKRVFVGAKFYDRLVSFYGTDCCRSLTNISEEQKYNGLGMLGLGMTSSGYQLSYKNIYFNAGSYGNVRIVASDNNFTTGTIVKITERLDDGTYETFNAIVLDSGDRNIGLDSKYIFDILVENQATAYKMGIHNQIEVEVLKLGTVEDQRNIKKYGHL